VLKNVCSLLIGDGIMSARTALLIVGKNVEYYQTLKVDLKELIANIDLKLDLLRLAYK
jgi:hypothetical protein